MLRPVAYLLLFKLCISSVQLQLCFCYIKLVYPWRTSFALKLCFRTQADGKINLSVMSHQSGFGILEDVLKEFNLEKDVKTSVKVRFNNLSNKIRE